MHPRLGADLEGTAECAANVLRLGCELPDTRRLRSVLGLRCGMLSRRPAQNDDFLLAARARCTTHDSLEVIPGMRSLVQFLLHSRGFGGGKKFVLVAVVCRCGSHRS